MDAYRVFISYARKDLDLVRKIVRVLTKNGLRPMWDKDLTPGSGFDDQIKSFIMHADVFLPVITPEATARGWVHQEIGFAIAHRIPILPVCRGIRPDGFAMIERFQAIECGDDTRGLKTKLSQALISQLVKAAEYTRPLYECAPSRSDRAKMLAEYATKVRDLGQYGMLRQRGGLTTFNIPKNGIQNPIWKERYGNVSRSDDDIAAIREERLALEEHAREAGCRLIIDTGNHFEEFGPNVRAIRIRCLLDFIDSMSEDKIRVAFTRNEMPESVTIVGDWYYTESIRWTARRGLQNTVFTWHAPTVRRRLRAFDQEFEEVSQEPGNKSATTLEGAKQILRDIMNGTSLSTPTATST